MTETPIGELTIAGVCIPWNGYHVETGRKNLKWWDDHLGWLAGFESLSYATDSRTIGLVDFNQRIPWTPGSRVPKHVHTALLRAFAGLHVATTGFFPWENHDDRAAGLARDGGWRAPLGGGRKSRGQLVDHMAHSRHLAVVESEAIGVFPKQTPDEYLSDHVGVWMDFR